MQKIMLQMDFESIINQANQFLEKIIIGTMDMLNRSTESLSSMF